MSRYEKITSEHLEMGRTHTKNDLVHDHEKMLENIKLAEQEKERCNKEMKEKTANLRDEIDKLAQQIDVIEEPIVKRRHMAEELISVHSKAERDIRIVISIVNAKELLKSGITTKADAIQYVSYGMERKIEEEDVREVKHERGSDIKVWAFKGRSYDNHMYYIAVKKGKMLSALIMEKASHRGDTTYAKDYGCKKVADFDKKVERVWSRDGLSMREWLNPELVAWIGMTATVVIEFWNSCD